jgi:hypothetical protein
MPAEFRQGSDEPAPETLAVTGKAVPVLPDRLPIGKTAVSTFVRTLITAPIELRAPFARWHFPGFRGGRRFSPSRADFAKDHACAPSVSS